MWKISANWFVGSYLNLQLKIALQISRQRIGKIWNFAIFRWNFLENATNDFPIFFSICWPYRCEQNMKEIRKFDKNFEGGGVKETFTPAISPYGSGAPKFCTLVVTLNICMPTEFWAPTLCSMLTLLWRDDCVTTWPCDEMTLWKKRACDELTGDELTEWRHDCVM